MNLRAAIEKYTSCNKCGCKVSIKEKTSFRQGLGTKLLFLCENEKCTSKDFDNSFFFYSQIRWRKLFKINTLATLAFRASGKGRSAALKTLSILNLGAPLSKKAWGKSTTFLSNKAATVASRNMNEAVTELQGVLQTENSGDVICPGASFDCTWNNRGWQAREGIVAAIAQITGKIIDIVHKSSSCHGCNKKQTARDKGDLTSLEFLEWFIQHEVSCLVNHTGSPQVSYLLYSHVLFRH